MNYKDNNKIYIYTIYYEDGGIDTIRLKRKYIKLFFEYFYHIYHQIFVYFMLNKLLRIIFFIPFIIAMLFTILNLGIKAIIYTWNENDNYILDNLEHMYKDKQLRDELMNIISAKSERFISIELSR